MYRQHEERLSKEMPVFIYLIGKIDNPNHIRAVTSIFGRVDHHVDVLKAFDLVFKTYYAFDLVFPPQCSVLWGIIMKLVYGVTRKVDLKYVSQQANRFISLIQHKITQQQDNNTTN